MLNPLHNLPVSTPLLSIPQWFLRGQTWPLLWPLFHGSSSRQQPPYDSKWLRKSSFEKKIIVSVFLFLFFDYLWVLNMYIVHVNENFHTCICSYVVIHICTYGNKRYRFKSNVWFTNTLLWTSINTCIYIQTLYSKQEWKNTYIISKTVLSCMLDDETRPICNVYLLRSFKNSNDDIFKPYF